ncbi:DoxX-like family protein [uncultured Aquimarina sp.]|uniref:DoxX-like family protein n=1 Tax=uncultured Aquimarina sp. TaxID=575652 RepID=UPI0026160412|nr:DoxX-like family protein [uncultured Aquimarina sp.]
MTKDQTQLIFKISVFLIFIGRAWQHLFWDAPYRSFFWDESLLKPIIEGVFNITWQEYATSNRTDLIIQNGIKINGVLYLIAAISVLMIKKNTTKWFRIPIYLGGCSLVLLTILLTKEKFYHIAQFFEHSIQFGLPFVLLYSYSKKLRHESLVFIFKILIAFTFFSHGLYAFGFYPVPGKFIDMTIQIFGFSETTAISFLYIAGILDFILAILIFIPNVQIYALWYAVGWGLLTAMARIVANFYWDFPLQSIHQNLHEVIYRIPHGLTPLLVILLLKKHSINKIKKAAHIGQPS